MLSFPILGRLFQADTADDRLRQWLVEFWDYSELYAVADVDYQIVLRRVDACSDFPLRPADRRLAMLDGQTDLYDEDPSFYLGDPNVGLRLNLLPGQAYLEMWGDGDAVWPLLHLAMIEAVRASGLLPLHASVAVYQGQAVAFLGESGRGKTTTLLSASLHGWQALSEDFVWLEPASMMVFGWDRGFRLLPDTFQQFQEILPRTAPVVVGKYFVAYERLGWSLREARPLKRLFWLERDAQQASEVKTLSKRQAALKLWDATGISLAQTTRTWTAKQIPHILKNTIYAELNLGRHEIPWQTLVQER